MGICIQLGHQPFGFQRVLNSRCTEQRSRGGDPKKWVNKGQQEGLPWPGCTGSCQVHRAAFSEETQPGQRPAAPVWNSSSPFGISATPRCREGRSGQRKASPRVPGVSCPPSGRRGPGGGADSTVCWAQCPVQGICLGLPVCSGQLAAQNPMIPTCSTLQMLRLSLCLKVFKGIPWKSRHALGVTPPPAFF